MIMRLPLCVSIAAISLLSGGCQTAGIGDPARVGPFYSPTNYSGDAQLPATLRRVVLLPVAGGSIAPAESAATLVPLLAAELQKQNRFEVIPLTREETLTRFRLEEISSTAAVPPSFMPQLRRDYAADGVVFVDLTVYKVYRPLSIGLRAKLVSTEGDARVLWAFDDVFAATDPKVANSARRHFAETDRHGAPADFTHAVLQSPSRFASYAAAEMFATLPRVYAPPLSAPAK
jgi:hypothetical protein